MKRVSCLALVSLALAAPAAARDGWVTASSTPVQFGLAPGAAQIFSQDTPVKGFRFTGLYGIQKQMVGLDIGGVNESESMTGVGLGGCNVTHGNAVGAHLSAFCNVVEEDYRGFQGVMLFNQVGGHFAGGQVGLANFAEKGAGAQIGLVNLSDSFKGVQLGLINVNRTGFLPFFPLINIGW